MDLLSDVLGTASSLNFVCQSRQHYLLSILSDYLFLVVILSQTIRLCDRCQELQCHQRIQNSLLSFLFSSALQSIKGREGARLGNLVVLHTRLSVVFSFPPRYLTYTDLFLRKQIVQRRILSDQPH